MGISIEVRGQLVLRFRVLFPHLNERQQRLVLGQEARLLGHGGVRAVGRAAGAAQGCVLEASRRFGVARGTVPAHLDRMQERGVITGYGPEVDPAALGYEVTAFITLEIRQAGGHDPVAERLAAIPEVLEP